MGHKNGGPKRHDWSRIVALCDGIRSASEISKLSGASLSLVHKVLMFCPDLPRRKVGSPGLKSNVNNNWKGGFEITKLGYVIANHNGTRGFLHRFVLGNHLGRVLLPNEVVHHRNDCTLDNRLSNLELFSDNSQHLRSTLGQTPIFPFGHANCEHDATHRERLKRGDFRVQQINRARELLPPELLDPLRTERYILQSTERRHPEPKEHFLPVAEMISLLVRL
jgi:hypothetical protein